MNFFQTEAMIIAQVFVVYFLESFYGWIERLVERTFSSLSLFFFPKRSNNQIYTLTGAESV